MEINRDDMTIPYEFCHCCSSEKTYPAIVAVMMEPTTIKKDIYKRSMCSAENWQAPKHEYSYETAIPWAAD